MGLFDIFKKKKKFSSSEVSELANFVFVGAVGSANGIAESDSEYKDLPMFRIVATLCSGLINLTDRIAFSVIPDKRGYVLDQLIEELAQHNVDAFIKGRLKLSNPLETMVNELNRGHLYLGQFKRVGNEDGSGEKDSFMWEFGKMFSSDLEKGADPALSILGANLLTNIISTVKIRDYLSKV